MSETDTNTDTNARSPAQSEYPRFPWDDGRDWKRLVDADPGKNNGLDYVIERREGRRILVRVRGTNRAAVVARDVRKLLLDNQTQLFGITNAGIEISGGAMPIYKGDSTDPDGYTQDYWLTQGL